MIYSIYRNLNKAKKEPSRFVWSIAVTGLSKKDGSPTLGSPGKVSGHTETITILNPVPVCKPGKLATIAAEDKRDVGAWILGTPTTEPVPTPTKPTHQYHRSITINPLSPKRNGRCEKAFHYCRVDSAGKVVIEEPVDFSQLQAIEFSVNGARAIHI